MPPGRSLAAKSKEFPHVGHFTSIIAIIRAIRFRATAGLIALCLINAAQIGKVKFCAKAETALDVRFSVTN
jgi:hypothetical protein